MENNNFNKNLTHLEQKKEGFFKWLDENNDLMDEYYDNELKNLKNNENDYDSISLKEKEEQKVSQYNPLDPNNLENSEPFKNIPLYKNDFKKFLNKKVKRNAGVPTFENSPFGKKFISTIIFQNKIKKIINSNTQLADEKISEKIWNAILEDDIIGKIKILILDARAYYNHLCKKGKIDESGKLLIRSKNKNNEDLKQYKKLKKRRKEIETLKNNLNI